MKNSPHFNQQFGNITLILEEPSCLQEKNINYDIGNSDDLDWIGPIPSISFRVDATPEEI